MKQKEIELQREIKKKKKKNNTSKQYVGLKRKFQGKLEKKNLLNENKTTTCFNL